MSDRETSRTLVKSQPELWAECSDPSSLARHLEPLGQLGEIRITRLEPETAVAWEGERASGTVRLEPSGWGTRVTLTARAIPSRAGASESSTSADRDSPSCADPSASGPAPRRGLLERLRSWLRPSARSIQGASADREPSGAAAFESRSAPESQPAPESQAAPESQPAPRGDPEPSDPDPDSILTSVLDSLGQAHRRPFSRA
ncbi:MAG: hypothetical protein ACR2IP_07030 [Solirubrobacteraceae bacterium]